MREAGRSFAAVAQHFAVAPSTVRTRARKEGWGAGTDAAAALDKPAAPRRAAGTPSTFAEAARRLLTRRLFKVLDIRLRMMELRMQSQLENAATGNLPPDEDEERIARQLGTLIKTIEQITELDPEPRTAAGGGHTDQSNDRAAAASEADAFRREIAERLEALLPPA